MARNEHLKKDISRLKQAAQRTATWSDRVEATKKSELDSGYAGHKSAKMMKRSKAIEERQRAAIEEKSGLLKDLETAESLKLSPVEYFADTLVSLSDVSISYGEKPVCEGVTFTLRRGERIALDGRNGSGKSSLLKLILGENIPHTGILRRGSGLVISYVAQDTSRLTGDLSSFARLSGINESLFKTILRKLDFERVQFEKRIEDFSGGQKKKVLLARSLCQSAHLYIWDEPLNFIDIYSRMQIEQLLREFAPTMLFVEHDRSFRDAIATRVIELRESR